MKKREGEIRKVEPIGQTNPTRPPLKDDDAAQEEEKRRPLVFGDQLDKSIQDLLKKKNK